MRLLGLGFIGGSEEELTTDFTDLLIFRKIDRTVSLFLCFFNQCHQ